MHVRSTDAGLEVLAPAKLNLFLEILGKRSDGFHEIETLMYPIGLYDTLIFGDDPGGQVSLICQQAASEAGGTSAASAAEALPVGADNLVVRAAEAVLDELKIRARVRFELEKRIPMGAGLGGGSTARRTT